MTAPRLHGARAAVTTSTVLIGFFIAAQLAGHPRVAFALAILAAAAALSALRDLAHREL